MGDINSFERASSPDAAHTQVQKMQTAMSVSSQDGSRRLNCLIEGESIVFVVPVGHDRDVNDLKKMIHREREMDTLKDVGPHTPELWKVSAIDESRCDVTSLTSTIGRH